MGLFDFLKGKEKIETKKQISTDSHKTEERVIHYETKLTARELKADQQTIDQIVEKMVEEDPFKRYYNGKTLEDMTPLASRLYKYADITTVNVDLDSKEKGRVMVVVEGTPLGYIPEQTAQTIQDRQEKHLLTAYVFVTGGPYMEYSKEQDKAIEDFSPLGLDIFIEFT